ncbi:MULTISPECIES: CGNR zinc finger domain-containing protein [unclassified Mycobacterium]|uniref:CGNR zinc finger domain-containing protein n=1 Tax=unclassified Mycobacterium TaxID=2642494 RepID=UPI0029C84F9C|nr:MULTISPECIES: CGNR zinc finger domain-containing protein [unclassified Mycobacterium]
MPIHRSAANLTVMIVNAWRDGLLDADWAAALLDSDALPLQHERRGDESDLDEMLCTMRRLAGELEPVFSAADAATAASRLNDLLSTVDVQVSVSIGDVWAPHLHFDAHHDGLAERLRVNCLVSIATVLADAEGAMRIGECASPSCGHVFVDFSRSGRQLYCSRRCATRSHVAAHRVRLQRNSR